jgi:hypothetical protein
MGLALDTSIGPYTVTSEVGFITHGCPAPLSWRLARRISIGFALFIDGLARLREVRGGWLRAYAFPF